MANPHFAKLADVGKHLPLAEVLSIERPANHWESHAGNAVYTTVDDAERGYGASPFVDAAPAFPALSRSRYLEHLRSMNHRRHGCFTVHVAPRASAGRPRCGGRRTGRAP